MRYSVYTAVCEGPAVGLNCVKCVKTLCVLKFGIFTILSV
jgi:hypothetical protein